MTPKTWDLKMDSNTWDDERQEFINRIEQLKEDKRKLQDELSEVKATLKVLVRANSRE
jgi:uncharacterized protein (UPF0335 family)